jgi:HK97 family phage portal protein
MPMLYDPLGVPVSIGKGRGDLRFTSVPFGANWQFGVPRVGKPNASFAWIYATQPWVAAAVGRLLMASIRVPLKVYRRIDDDSVLRLRAGDHPLATAIEQPWEGGSQADLVQSLVGPLLVHGNGTSPILSGAGESIRFDPSDWRFSVPIMVQPDQILGWEITQRGETEWFGVQDVLHIKKWSSLSAIGISPLFQLGVTLEIEDAAQRWQKALLANGAKPPSAVVADKTFLGEKAEARQQIIANLREDVNSIYVGPENQGRPLLLPPGLDWKMIGHSAVEAELISQREVNQIETCAVYHLMPPMLGILSRATFNNIETARQMMYTDSLGPPLVLVEQSINAQIVRGILREDDIFVEFDFAGVLRGDRLKEVQALQQAIQTALMTPNEGRSALNLPKSDAPGMDNFWIPTNNFTEIGAAAAEKFGQIDVTSTDDAIDGDDSPVIDETEEEA